MLDIKGPIARNILHAMYSIGCDYEFKSQLRHYGLYYSNMNSLYRQKGPSFDAYVSQEDVLINGLDDASIPILPVTAEDIFMYEGKDRQDLEKVKNIVCHIINESKSNDRVFLYPSWDDLKWHCRGNDGVFLNLKIKFTLDWMIKYKIDGNFGYSFYGFDQTYDTHTHNAFMTFPVKMKMLECFMEIFSGNKNIKELIDKYGEDTINGLLPRSLNPFEHERMQMLKQEFEQLKKDFLNEFPCFNSASNTLYYKLCHKLVEIEKLNWSVY